MTALTQKDLSILAHYAQQRNRELYWNYLAQKPGNDGYGLLALGVVRNDNAPGATANAYAAEYARAHGGRVLSEREWETFGVTLIQEDLALRNKQFKAMRPDLALNLPARNVQDAHDIAFDRAGIDPNAWTPRELLEAARRHGGEREAAQVWSTMLDNRAAGLNRFAATMVAIAWRYNDDRLDALEYTGRLALARGLAGESLPHTDPDRIGSDRFHYRHDRRRGVWFSVAETRQGMPDIREVRDSKLIGELDDTRALRLERLQKRGQFHPDDPNRHRAILRSPRTLAEADDPTPFESAALAHAATARDVGDGLRAGAPHDPRHADHPAHAAYQGVLDKMQVLNGSRAQPWDAATVERIAASLAGQALADPLVRRVDEVVLSRAMPDQPAERLAFAVYKPFGDRLPVFRAQVDVGQAAATAIEQSFDRIEALQREQARTQPAHGEPMHAQARSAIGVRQAMTM